MTLSKVDRQQKLARRALPAAVRRSALTSIRAPLVQRTVAVAVGLMLGLYLLVAIAQYQRWVPFFVLAAFLPFVVMIIGDIQKFLLAVILLELPLHLDIALLYDGHAVALYAIGGLNISVTTICLGVLYALWLYELLTKATTLPRSLRASLPLVAYIGAVALSVVVAGNVRLAFFELFMLFQTFLLFVYIIKSVQTRQDVMFVITLLLIGLVFESLVMIGLRILGHSVSIARIYAGIDAGGRVYGTIGSPNTAASYLTLLLAPTFGVMLTPFEQRYRWLAMLAFGLGTVGLLLTFSRGGWMSLAVSIGLFCLVAFYRGWLSTRILLTIVVMAVVILFLFREPILDRLLGNDEGAADSRTMLARQALTVIEANPVLGVGINNYAMWAEQHIVPELDDHDIRTVHNKYLLVWAETGIVGLVAFLGFLFTAIRWGWQVSRIRDCPLSPLALGITAAIVGQTIHMFFDIFHSRPQVQILWLMVGLIIAIRDIEMGTG